MIKWIKKTVRAIIETRCGTQTVWIEKSFSSMDQTANELGKWGKQFFDFLDMDCPETIYYHPRVLDDNGRTIFQYHGFFQEDEDQGIIYHPTVMEGAPDYKIVGIGLRLFRAPLHLIESIPGTGWEEKVDQRVVCFAP